ncbi:hypothetical protein KFL_000250270 [Klebsormidium nitens]|uniref:Uncharacterized protein n=1 Tax=Klebsormidium nitens TaxID=105231 RepID=A0A1Y1HKM9_KLENI|nr:hypothetical protein KFL_000250270 [Klebsormidium nitens]|eukprot:GAQ79150.1 hypothetical protein KFL_000250270 [Klebsormidium nitens]
MPPKRELVCGEAFEFVDGGHQDSGDERMSEASGGTEVDAGSVEDDVIGSPRTEGLERRPMLRDASSQPEGFQGANDVSMQLEEKLRLEQEFQSRTGHAKPPGGRYLCAVCTSGRSARRAYPHLDALIRHAETTTSGAYTAAHLAYARALIELKAEISGERLGENLASISDPCCPRSELVFSPPSSPPSLPPGGGDYILLRWGRSLPHMRGGERSRPPDDCGGECLPQSRTGGEFPPHFSERGRVFSP